MNAHDYKEIWRRKRDYDLHPTIGVRAMQTTETNTMADPDALWKQKISAEMDRAAREQESQQAPPPGPDRPAAPVPDEPDPAPVNGTLPDRPKRAKAWYIREVLADTEKPEEAVSSDVAAKAQELARADGRTDLDFKQADVGSVLFTLRTKFPGGITPQKIDRYQRFGETGEASKPVNLKVKPKKVSKKTARPGKGYYDTQDLFPAPPPPKKPEQDTSLLRLGLAFVKAAGSVDRGREVLDLIEEIRG